MIEIGRTAGWGEGAKRLVSIVINCMHARSGGGGGDAQTYIILLLLIYSFF